MKKENDSGIETSNDLDDRKSQKEVNNKKTATHHGKSVKKITINPFSKKKSTLSVFDNIRYVIKSRL